MTQTMVHRSTCPHDCPSTCALEIEIADGRMGKVRGAKSNSYTDGVICAKVARYYERNHHPDRLKKPLLRRGSKGSGEWGDISWDAALDLVAERFLQAEQEYGSETVWPYAYAGTMGLVQRDSIKRLTHAKRYSKQHSTICSTVAAVGFAAGTGVVMGPDPREMAVSDCVVIWGTNPVSTQVNVMTHAIKARKSRGAKIVVIDIYQTDTMKQADLALCIRPGTDAALACAVMHCLFRDGRADREYMEKFADDPSGLKAHLADRDPAWAAQITGLSIEEIEVFAAMLAERPRSYLRLGYGFTRSRNGAISMHAASCVATVLGAWQHEGGGAFHCSSDIYAMNKELLQGVGEPDVRELDQSQIGRILTGDAKALQNGPPVTAMLVQNTNPANVAPEQALVLEGLERDDLFTVVHEQFMTDTAELADLVLPATTFVEHDDIYRGGGHQHIMLGPKLLEPLAECRPNLFVIEELGRRLGVSDHPGFGLTAREHIDALLKASDHGDLEALERETWIDVQPDFETSHYSNGFHHADGKFRFRADWPGVVHDRPSEAMGRQGPHDDMPSFPDQWNVTEPVDGKHPFRLATSPARTFLNSTFTETPGSKKREGRPTVRVSATDAAELGVEQDDLVSLSNARGEVFLHVVVVEGQRRKTLIAEGLHPNGAHVGGRGINTLVGADPVAPHGGAAFHDIAVALRKA